MKIRLVVVLAFATLVVSGPRASAQSADPFFTDFSANYDFIYHQPGDTSHAGAHFDVASTWKRDVPYIGPVGEVGFNHFDCCNIVSLMGGLRIRANVDPDILPFGQFLVGLWHCGVCLNANDFAIQAGGGVDFRTPNPNLRVRVQFDWRRVFDDVFSFNAERVSAGVVIPLNR
jgi:hypothetical protein